MEKMRLKRCVLLAGTLLLSTQASAALCTQAWVDDAAYPAGTATSYLGHNYTAISDITGQSPAASPLWKDQGECSSKIDLPEWDISRVYTVGKQVVFKGAIYQAKWYTQGENPEQSGQWDVWKNLGQPKPSVALVQSSDWKNGAKAAYSMLHDDLCAWITDGQIDYAAPALKQRGLVAAFGMITGTCGDKHWAAAKQFLADGNEIYSHTRNHIDARSKDWDAVGQISGSSDDMAARLAGYRPSFFAWPSDVAADAPLAYLRTASGYIGGRAPNRIAEDGGVIYDGHTGVINSAQLADSYQVRWDLYTDQGQWSAYEEQVKAGGDLLNLHVDAAINQGGWATRTMHGVNDGSWMSVPLAQYNKHLDYVKAKADAGLLWVAGPSSVIKYTYARDFCKATLTTTHVSSVSFDTSAPECKKFATPITLQLYALSTSSKLSARQKGKALNLLAGPANSYFVNVDPLAGAVTFSAQ
jgi:chitodextrinase/peptidoglycan/xylan/chitin deacetylase (PgdA/CDA1 family)